MPAERRGINRLGRNAAMLFPCECRFGVKGFRDRQSGRLDRDRRRIVRPVQPLQFRLDPARHGLAEGAAEIERPEAVRHHLRGHARAGEIPCRTPLPDRPAPLCARLPDRCGSANVTRTGINAPVTGTTPRHPAHLVERRIAAGGLVGAQRHIVDSVEIDRLVDMRQQGDKVLAAAEIDEDGIALGGGLALRLYPRSGCTDSTPDADFIPAGVSTSTVSRYL